MSNGDADNNDVTSIDDNEAIRHLKGAVASGKPWHIALLEAMALWTWPEEEHNGHCYHYLIDGEAFDWLLLAERLCEEIADEIPEDEKHDLLFYGKLPEELSDDTFMDYIGSAKHHAYLNYLYGVIVEKFVILAVEEEIGKERNSYIFSRRGEGWNDAYLRVYGANHETLLRLFRDEKGYTGETEMTIDQLQEFTYWLFKYRLKNCDKERVASDTRKGVEYLRRQRTSAGIRIPHSNPQNIIEHGK